MLLPHDTDDLRGSAWTDATIVESGAYTELDPAKVARILNWDRPAVQLGPCLVFPFVHADGTPNGFARIKPSKPRTDKEGKKIKYESPLGISPRVLFTPSAAAAATDTSIDLFLTEGEKKAWAIHQSGSACLGLCGIWAWQKPKSDPRELVDDLAGVVWRGRRVGIIFDTDDRRNPNVNHARAELARVLTDLGTDVRLIDLPVGPRESSSSLPTKMGADNFIVRFGEDAFRCLVNQAMQLPPKPRPLEDYRHDLSRVRVESVGQPGVYLDTSPTGAGKTYADLPAVRAAGTSLTVAPTHRNGKEVREIYAQSGLLAEAYPEQNRETCSNYDEATRALESGLSASAAVCPSCPCKGKCDYSELVKAAEAADHRISTHKRAQMGMAGMAKGRRYVTIHESPTDLLRPVAEVSCGLDRVAEVARTAKDSARDAGNMDLYCFLWRMEDAAESLVRKLQETDNTTALDRPPSAGIPRLVDAWLFSAMRSSGVFPSADPVRVVRALAAGELHEITIRVDRIFGPGRQTTIKKSIIAVWQTTLPDDASVWLNDATTDAAEIESIAGRPVADMTPRGRLEQQHAAVQIPIDVKLSTSPGTVVNLLRGFFTMFQNAQRVGIICHRCHVPTFKGTPRKGPVLDEGFRRRIAKIEYYHSGEGRASNRWIDECDMIVVLGTPRVPPSAVALRLIQTGRTQAAERDGEWGRDYWSGITVAGKRRTIRTSAYRDHDWHAAYRALVRAELIQAVGRGRGICPNGVPVVVLSNEPLGLPLLDSDIEPLAETGLKVLAEIRRLSATNPKGESKGELSAMNPKIYILDSVAVSTASLVGSLAMPERTVRWNLNDLVRRGLVEKIGERGGWILTSAGAVFFSPAPSPEIRAAAGLPVDDNQPELADSRGAQLAKG